MYAEHWSRQSISDGDCDSLKLLPGPKEKPHLTVYLSPEGLTNVFPLSCGHEGFLVIPEAELDGADEDKVLVPLVSVWVEEVKMIDEPLWLCGTEVENDASELTLRILPLWLCVTPPLDRLVGRPLVVGPEATELPALLGVGILL